MLSLVSLVLELFVNILTMVPFQIIPIAEANVMTFVESINGLIINPIIFFLFALAMVYFLYGLAQYLLSPDNEEVRKKSKSVMLWGIVGLFIMVAVFSIMNLLINTFGVKNIKLNNIGQYVVDDNAGVIKDIDRADNANSNQDLFKGSIDISIQDVPQLDDFTNPFPTYSVNAKCWNEPISSDKKDTEFEALKLVRNNARAKFLNANPTISDTDLNYKSYPISFATKVLYDKANKKYYAWVDARAPVKGGTMSDCKLEIVTPARVIKDGVVDIDISAQDTPDLPPETFTTSPFATYEKSVDCWQKPLYAPNDTEFSAIEVVKNGARAKFLNANPTISSTDPNYKSYPILFATEVLYDKANKKYYAWVDARAPLNGKPVTACNLKVLSPAPVIPDGVIPIDISTSNIPDSPAYIFNNDPFAVYGSNYQCWRGVFHREANTEYQSVNLAKDEARQKFLDVNNISPTNLNNQKYPTIFESKIFYDKINKLYHAWLDARAPIRGGLVTSCDLKVLIPAKVLPDRTAMSAKPDPFGSRYVSDDNYYRIHDSAAWPDYLKARREAINNALIQIATAKGLTSTSQVLYTILGELYYPRNINTGYYDYFVVVESSK